MDIKNTLIALSNSCGIGTVTETADFAQKLLQQSCTVRRIGGLGLIGEINNGSEHTILLDAHIDEVGFVVTNVSDNGFLTVQKCGGIDLRHLPAKAVTVHGKEKIPAVFVSTPPHLDKGGDMSDDIGDYKIDTGLNAQAGDKISIGDFVTYRRTATVLCDDTVCGKSLDNRAGVTALLEVADRLRDKKIDCNVLILLSDAEELGLRGAKTSVFGKKIDEAIVVDVSFGDGPDVPKTQCGNLRGGAMVGISPVINRQISNKLQQIAINGDIPFQKEVMGGNTSTNADAITLNESGIPTGLLSIPLRNMHTDVEVVSIPDIVSVADIIEEYILSGGCFK